MWLARTGIICSSLGVVVYDTDALAYITNANITDSTQKSAVNELFLDFKSAGIYTKMTAFYPMLGGNAFSHKFNAKDPRDLDAAYRLSFVGGWNHTTTGALPNGTTGYANTFITPLNNLTSLSHMSFYSRTDSTNYYMLGVQDDQTAIGAQMYLEGNKTIDYYSCSNVDASGITISSTSTTGMYIVSRTTNQSLKAYKNGTLVGSNVSASFGYRANIRLYLCGSNYRNSGGTNTIFYGNKECAFASIGSGLTDAEALALRTAVQKFNTTLGRNI